MKETRLYFRLEELAGGDAKFHYYNGLMDEKTNTLECFNKTISSDEIQKILEIFEYEKNLILYNINRIEYSHLIKDYNCLIFYENSSPNKTAEKRFELRKQILRALRLKNKFKIWFEKHGYPMPETQ